MQAPSPRQGAVQRESSDGDVHSLSLSMAPGQSAAWMDSKTINLSTIVVDHTKFDHNWHFGMWKLKWRNSTAETLGEVTATVNNRMGTNQYSSSSSSTVRTHHLVCEHDRPDELPDNSRAPPLGVACNHDCPPGSPPDRCEHLLDVAPPHKLSKAQTRDIKARAFRLLHTGTIPLFLPARENVADPVQLRRGDVTVSWPPSGWREMGPNACTYRCQVTAAMLESPGDRRSNAELLDVFAMLVLPGSKLPDQVGPDLLAHTSRFYVHERLQVGATMGKLDNAYL
jgi:hypothetical protein